MSTRYSMYSSTFEYDPISGCVTVWVDFVCVHVEDTYRNRNEIIEYNADDARFHVECLDSENDKVFVDERMILNLLAVCNNEDVLSKTTTTTMTKTNHQDGIAPIGHSRGSEAWWLACLLLPNLPHTFVVGFFFSVHGESFGVILCVCAPFNVARGEASERRTCVIFVTALSSLLCFLFPLCGKSLPRGCDFAHTKILCGRLASVCCDDDVFLCCLEKREIKRPD